MTERREVSDEVIATRFTLQARAVLYNAREVVAERAAPTIDLPHMLVGILRADSEAVAMLLGPGWTIQDLEREVLSKYEDKPGVAGHIGHPASTDFGDILREGVDLADALGQRQVTPLHFLAALLEHRTSDIPRLLTKAGVTREQLLKTLRR